MPLGKAFPPTFTFKPFTEPKAATPPDKPRQGIITMYDTFTGPLNGSLAGTEAELARVYADVANREALIRVIKERQDRLGQTGSRSSLVWEGPAVIELSWPDNQADAYAKSKAYEQLLQANGQTLDSFLKDGYHIKSAIDQGDMFFDKATVEADIRARGTDNYNIKNSIPWDFQPLASDATRMWLWGKKNFPNGGFPQWFRIGDQVYRLQGKGQTGYLVPADDYLAHTSPDMLKQHSLQLFGSDFIEETQRLRSAGMPVTSYDAYQYSINGGKIGYTIVNQILARDSADFSGIPDRTIVAVGADYYFVNKGIGTKLDAAPTGILMGLPANARPPSGTRYQNAIVSTLSLIQDGTTLAAGDYDMCMYSYGGGQTGYAKLPPVVVGTDPRNGGFTTYPPGTLLQYTDAQNNTGYYRVTGPGTVASVEDAATIARTVTGTPPDLSAIAAGTLIKLDDGKLYWVTKDHKTQPADGAPLLRFLSPEKRANWDGIQVTEALQEAGLRLGPGDADTCVFLDRNGNTVFAKLPAKVFDGPGAAPNGKDYAPGDVVKSRDGTQAWYIDEQGQAQEAKSRIVAKEVVEAGTLDPSKYDPGTVVADTDGNYYRITYDQQAVRISYPLEELICNPSDAQISALQDKLTNLSNEKASNMTRLTIRLQQLAGDRNWLATMLVGIITMLTNTANGIGRNMA
jgi:hypothetical protein